VKRLREYKFRGKRVDNGKMTKYDIYRKAIETAKAELEQAERNLEIVEPALTVWAAHEVVAKKEKLNVLLGLAKKELVSA
jgi:hypothetical protein